MALSPTEEAQTRQLIAQQAPLLSLAGNEATITSKLGATKVNLSQLPAGTAVADADLLLIRQGTTDKGIAASAFKTYAGVGAASETVAGAVELATAAETQTGTDNTRAVHPAGLATLTTSETRAGLAEIATAAEVLAGSDDARIVTPLKLRSGFSATLAANGHIRLPVWLGGWQVCWGKTANVVAGPGTAVTFSNAFANACRTVLLSQINASGSTTTGFSQTAFVLETSLSTTGFTAQTGGSTGFSQYYFAIGN